MPRKKKEPEMIFQDASGKDVSKELPDDIKDYITKKEIAKLEQKEIPESGIHDKDVIYKGQFYFAGSKLPKEVEDFVKRSK